LLFVCFTVTNCGGGGEVEIDTSDRIPIGSILFYEDFEVYPVGSPPSSGWAAGGGQYNSIEVQFEADHKLYIDGPSSDTSGGDAQRVAWFNQNYRPTYVSFHIHPYPLLQDSDWLAPSSLWMGNVNLHGKVDLEDYADPAIFFSFLDAGNGKGALRVNEFQVPIHPANYFNLDRSFFVEFRNITWDFHPYVDFDLYINGHLIERCIPLLNPVSAFHALSVGNFDYGRFHIDDILFADIELEHACPHVSENPPGVENQPVPPPETPPEPQPVTFIPEVGAWCRLGPSMDYPALSSFTAGVELEVTGQNIDRSWWFIAEHDCWISDQVGGFREPPGEMPIVVAPVLPQKPEEPPEIQTCNEGLGKDSCEALGGTWSQEPGQPSGKCVCP
jgi:hypothetical protein